MSITKQLLFIVFGLFLCGETRANHAPIITGVQVSHEPVGSRNIVIKYNLLDADGDSCTVALELLLRNGRRSEIQSLYADGDIGRGVVTGNDREIQWMSHFCPCYEYGIDFDFRITAFDGTATGGEMILVRGSIFDMGSERESDNAQPVHRVRLSSYFMDKFEVTNAQFTEFVEATGYVTDAEKDGWSWVHLESGWKKKAGSSWRDSTSTDRANMPVVHVSRRDTEAYANWAGKKLPSEAQWERVASAGDGRPYPWGPEWQERASNHGSDGNSVFGDQDGFADLAPVGSFIGGRSPEGFHDLSGNVREWVGDFYTPYKSGEISDPTNLEEGTCGIVRGGGFDTPSDNSTAQFRHKVFLDEHFSNTGFRCAVDKKSLMK